MKTLLFILLCTITAVAQTPISGLEYMVVKQMTGTVNDYTNYGTITPNGYFAEITLSCNDAGLKSTKVYFIPINDNTTGGAWYNEDASLASNLVDDYQLQISVGTGTASFRLKNIGTHGGVTTNVALSFRIYGNSNSLFTTMSGTGNDATVYQSYNALVNANPNKYLTGITSAMVLAAIGFTPYNATNPNGYISSYTETDPQFPTKFAQQTTANLAENAGFLYFTNARARAALSSGSGINYNTSTGVIATTTKTFNFAPTHPIQTVAAAANGFQLSTTQDSFVTYSVKVTTAVQIGLVTTVEGYVALEIAATNSTLATDWKEVGRTSNGQAVSLAVALASTGSNTGAMFGLVPAGYYARLRSVNVSGTPTYSYISGQEVLN